MKKKYTSQRLVGGLMIIMSVTSLVLLRLQFWTSDLGMLHNPPPSRNSNLHSFFYATGVPNWSLECVSGLLFLALILTTLVSLYNLRLIRRSEGAERLNPENVAETNGRVERPNPQGGHPRWTQVGTEVYTHG